MAYTQGLSVMDRALTVTELHEAIIGHLPCKDVLLAQRVSKTWQATIQNSAMLQKALCFRSINRPLVAASKSYCDYYEDDFDFNDLKQPRFASGLSAVQFVEACEKSSAFFINLLIECLLQKRLDSDLLDPGDLLKKMEDRYGL